MSNNNEQSVKVGTTSFVQPMPSSAEHNLQVKKSSNQQQWHLLDGPPYANGALHMGHVRNKLTKDVLARAWSKKLNVLWRGGWDCHGLPVERNVEAMGVSRFPVNVFVLTARTYALSQVELQKSQMSTLQTMCDLENNYKTMDYSQQANTLRVFTRMVEEGHVYSSFQPVSWCTECQSTVANMESEEKNLSMKDLYFMLKLSDGNYAWVWTTQAWSLYYHDNMLVNPDATYELRSYKVGDEVRNVWMTSNAFVVPEWQFNGVLKTAVGRELEGLTYNLQWTESKHVVKARDVVNPEAGTGWLHASAACAMEDYNALQEHERVSLSKDFMKPDGLLSLTNKKFYHTHLDVCDWYSNNDYGWFHVVSVPRLKAHCWRHKTALTVRPALQWYVRVDKQVKSRALERMNKVTFVPENSRNRLWDAVSTRPDWCVSRQRTWGVPLGVYANDKGELAPFAVDEMKRLADTMEKEGSLALWNLPAERDGYTLCTDVLDVWFDSGACFLTTTDEQVQCVVEGHDQHRGWFQSSLLVSSVLDERLPYEMVVSHGFVLDASKQKLSKSAPSKQKMPSWNEVHPDVLRVWCTMGSVESDRLWDNTSLVAAQKLAQKWRNTWRFCLANMSREVPKSSSEWLNAEKWMVYATEKVVNESLEQWSRGAFEQATATFHTLCNDTLSSHAFSMLKDRLYCGNDSERKVAQDVLYALAYYLRKGLECVLPCTMAESDHFEDLSNMATPYFVFEEEQSWNELLNWRLNLQKEFAAVSQKGHGTLQHASAKRPSVKMEDEDLLQWSATSELHDEGELVKVLHGYKCPRCRWVFSHEEEHCPRCETRGF